MGLAGLECAPAFKNGSKYGQHISDSMFYFVCFVFKGGHKVQWVGYKGSSERGKYDQNTLFIYFQRVNNN